MAQGRLIPHHGEAIVLRTWPFLEADLLVSLLTREQGVVKGVARHAMRSRRRFGGALEPGTHVTAHYTERPREDLVRLDSLEILWSPLSSPIDPLRLAGLQLVVEVLEQSLPELAPEDNVFRLALSVLQATDGNPVWLPATYFCVWMNRLMGWLPALGHCSACGVALRGGPIWWSPTADGVTCFDDRRPGGAYIAAESVALAQAMAGHPLPEMMAAGTWGREEASDLRAFAIANLERHLQRHLRSAYAFRSDVG